MMDADTAKALPPHAVLERAAHWYALLRDGRAGDQDRAKWQAWLRADEVHQIAWRYVEDVSSNFEPLRGQPDTRLVADTLSVAAGRPHSRRRVLAGTVAGAALFGWLSWRQALLPGRLMAWGADHRSGIGEQREITLADGSHVWLNTASAINVRINARERVVELIEGEVFIATAGDSARPFFVQTEYGRMQALGTRFNVRHDTDRVQLAVYESAVEIRAASSGAVCLLRAGQQAHFSAHDIFPIETADAAREAWIQGTLVADNIPLREVVDELRRYRRGHLGLADEVADLTVYGNFPINDPDRVLRMLAAALPIRVSQPMPWWTTIAARR